MATFTQVWAWRFEVLSFVVIIMVSCFIPVCNAATSTTDYCARDFEQCICTEEVVECHNEKTLIDNLYNLYPGIKDNVTRIVITGSTFKEMPQNFFGSCRNEPSLVLRQLKYVDLSSNEIQTIHGKTFHCMPNIETLILRHNQWQIDKKDAQTGYFTSMPSLKTLDLTNTFEDVYDGTIHFSKLAKIFNEHNVTMLHLENLYLGENEFVVLSEYGANSLCKLTGLRYLNFSHNYFIEPYMPTEPSCFGNLQTLDFSFNQISYLSDEFMKKIDDLSSRHSLQTVHLEGNPFSCDCELIKTWKWLNTTTSVVDKTHLTCGSGYHSSYIGRRVLDLQPSDMLCENMSTTQQSHAGTVVLVIIFLVIIITAVSFVIVNRTKVKYCFSSWKKKMPKVKFNSKHGYSSVQEVATI